MVTETAGQIRGVVPIVPTPFLNDETIDLHGVRRCVEFAAACKLSAVCLPAYASEFYKLNEAERLSVVEAAVAASGGKVAVIAQSNHPSAKVAAALAARHEQLGANLISFAMPRQFALPDADRLDYCRRICDAVRVNVLIQDFNPGGPTVGGDFAQSLLAKSPNFRYLKLEEPLMAPKVRAIRTATSDRIGVLEGWGGMYLPELIDSGIVGLMPGLGPADLLQHVWNLALAGQREAALDWFEPLLPQLVFTLQNMEFWVRMEKELLAARGVIDPRGVHVRAPAWTPDEEMLQHGRLLNARVIRACEKLPRS